MSDVNVKVFSFSGPNPVWDNVILVIKEQYEAEAEYAVGEQTDEGKRAWSCGRASSLKDLLRYLEDIRQHNRTDS